MVRGGLPRHGMNVFFIAEGARVTCFDSGSREMANELVRAASSFGGISRVVLSHGHADHRGAARAVGAPVWCHLNERPDVEGDAGRHYWAHGHAGRARDRLRGRAMSTLRDGGPVTVAGTLQEGDRVGDFTVLHLFGHAPGHIGLWRDSDRTLLAADCFYAIDAQTAGLPKAAYNHDSRQARASVLKAAGLEPAQAWPGHGPPLRGDVRAILERAVGSA